VVGKQITIGVLALQGDFEAHLKLLGELGARAHEVRVPADLEGLDGLIIPGGESTTMTIGVNREGLASPLRDFANSGKPILGTCAGMIMLDRAHLGIGDFITKRNAFGRQINSFEIDLELEGFISNKTQSRAVFIRAPWIEDHGPSVQVLATVESHPVAVKQDNLVAVSFHPELSGETALHRWLIATAKSVV